MFGKIWEFIRGVISKMIGVKNIETALSVTPYISTDMANAIELWNNIYLDKAPWLHEFSNAEPFVVKSLNLGAFISSEKARMATIEMNSEITDPTIKAEVEEVEVAEEATIGEDTKKIKDKNKKPKTRAEFLNTHYKKLMKDIRRQLEYGVAKGGLVIKPYILNNTDIGFNYIQADSFYPISFNSAGDVTEAVFAEKVTEKNLVYTHLEYHKLEGETITVINKAYKKNVSNNASYASEANLGVEVPLTEIEAWKDLQEETKIANVDRILFAYFKMPEANTIDVYSPLGVSGFSRATKLIEEADKQYSRILWEYEGSELAIDTDRDALKIEKDADGNDITVLSRLQQRLFRKVDLNDEGTYEIFNPNIRDSSLFNGLNKILMRIEDVCALSRGTMADVTTEARTATELKILKQRSYSANVDIQQALEETLKDVIYIMDIYATLYKLAPKGKYEASYEWDDSIIMDKESELGKRLTLMQNGLDSKLRIRMWYFGETENQARKALAEIAEEVKEMMALQNPPDEFGDMSEDEPGEVPGNKTGKKLPSNKKIDGKEKEASPFDKAKNDIKNNV